MIKAIQWLAGTKASGFLPLKAEKDLKTGTNSSCSAAKGYGILILRTRHDVRFFKRIQNKIHAKPDLSGPKNSFESVISYQQDTNRTLKTE